MGYTVIFSHMRTEITVGTPPDGSFMKNPRVEVFGSSGEHIEFGNRSINSTLAHLLSSPGGVPVGVIPEQNVILLNTVLAATESGISIQKRKGMLSLRIPEGFRTVITEGEEKGVRGLLAIPYILPEPAQAVKASGEVPHVIFSGKNQDMGKPVYPRDPLRSRRWRSVS